MKIFFHNIKNGGSSELINKISEDYDIVSLQEFQPCVKEEYEKILKEKGYNYFQGPDVSMDRQKCNSTFIASKKPITERDKPHEIRAVKQFWEEAETENGLSVLSVYVPCGNGFYGKYKVNVWDAIIARAELAIKENQKLLIMGDFNTASEGDYTGESTLCGEYIDEIRKLGFIDVWSKFHTDDDDRWTYITVNGYKRRFDYIFCSPALKNTIKSAEHIHDFRFEKLTDHSAVTVELE